MTYQKQPSASLDLILKANKQMTTDEIQRFRRQLDAFSRIPSPMWHLNAAQRKFLLKSFLKERPEISHGWGGVYE